MSAPDFTDLTSGDQCNRMCAAGYKGSASTLTRNLDVVDGSVSLIGSLPNCPSAWCAVDDISKRYETESLFWDLITPIVQTVTRPSTSHLPPCLVAPTAFLSVTQRHFIPLAKLCLARAERSSTTTLMEGLDCFLTLGEACVVTCADRVHCSGISLRPRLPRAFSIQNCRACYWRVRRERPQHTPSVSHLRSTDVLHWRPLAQRLFVWTMGESCAVTCAERYQAANETRWQFDVCVR